MLQGATFPQGFQGLSKNFKICTRRTQQLPNCMRNQLTNRLEKFSFPPREHFFWVDGMPQLLLWCSKPQCCCLSCWCCLLQWALDTLFSPLPPPLCNSSATGLPIGVLPLLPFSETFISNSSCLFLKHRKRCNSATWWFTAFILRSWIFTAMGSLRSTNLTQKKWCRWHINRSRIRTVGRKSRPFRNACSKSTCQETL